MAAMKNSKPIKLALLWWLIFIFFFLFSLGNVGAIKSIPYLPALGLANMAWLGLILAFSALALIQATPLFYTSHAKSNFYIFLQFAFVFTSFSIPAVSGNFAFGTMLSHIAVFLVIVALNASIIKTGLSPFFWAIFLGSQIIHFMDWLALIFDSPMNTKSDSFGIGYAGIGVLLGFGEHGILLLWGIFSGLAIVITKRSSKIVSFFIITLSVSMAGMIFLSQSRSSIIALILGLGVLITFYPYTCTLKRLIIRFFAIPIGITFTIVAIIMTYQTRPRTLHLRTEQFYRVFEISLEHPFSGIGWNIWHPNYDSLVIHNAFLNYLAAAGYIPFLLYIAIFVYVIAHFFSHKRKIGNKHDAVTFSVLFSIFAATVFEISLFKSTPSSAFAVSGLLLVSYQYIGDYKFSLSNRFRNT